MSEDEHTIPVADQKVFAGGVKRRHIDFVRAAPDTKDNQLIQQTSTSTSAGDQYLALVLRDCSTSKYCKITATNGSHTQQRVPEKQQANNALCGICNLPTNKAGSAACAVISRSHETSLAHQVCLEHSYPPSDLDRNRQGLKYLSSYGWDPDGRLGLGPAGEGMRAPIKAKVKDNTSGLGVDLSKLKREREEPVERLDAKQARKKYVEERKKRQRLQELFYQSDDVGRYLGVA